MTPGPRAWNGALTFRTMLFETWLALTIMLGAGAIIGAMVVDAWSRVLWRRRRLTLDMRRYSALADALAKRDRDIVQALSDNRSWTGFQYFRVSRKKRESLSTMSFYLRPYDERPITPFLPGQYLTFRFHKEGEREPMIRCYSLSRAHAPDRDYRVTVKRLPPPCAADPETPWGMSSSYLYEKVREGSVVEVAPPSGRFTLDLAAARPVVFIAGGIGITPFLSMIEHVSDHEPHREAWLFHGVQCEDERLMAGQLRAWAEQANFHYITCYSGAGQPGRVLEEYEEKGFVTTDLLRRWLPSCNYEFYICGPPPMIVMVMDALGEWGVPPSSIHVEAFSSETVRELRLADVRGAAPCEVTFRAAGKKLRWTKEAGTILDLAENNSIYLPSGCRAGNCGTCAAPVLRGSFRYIFRPEAPVATGYCLACISVPEGDIELA